MTAYANPSAWYIYDNSGSSLGWHAVPAWQASHTYAAGALVRQAATVATPGNERVFVCIVAGTSGATEPTWVTTKGAKSPATGTDGTNTLWMECTGQPVINGDLSLAHQPVWALNLSPALGNIIYDSATSTLQICTTAGAGKTSGTISFSATAGVTTVDNAATWTSLGATSNFGPWAAPHARGVGAFTSGFGLAGNDFYFTDNHAETQSTVILWSYPGANAAACRMISVDHTAAVPPTGVKAGATVTSTNTGTTAMTLGNGGGIHTYFYGINFVSSGSIVIGGTGDTAAEQLFDGCSFVIGAAIADVVQMGGSASSVRCTWNNTTLSFGNASQVMNLGSGYFWWKNTPAALPGTPVTGLLVSAGTTGGSMTAILEGLDLSAGITSLGTVQAGGGSAYICVKDCKMQSSAPATAGAGSLVTIDFVRSGASTDVYRCEHHNSMGDLTTTAVIVRTGGASDGTTAYAHEYVTNAVANSWLTFNGLPVVEWNSVTGTNRNVTMYGLANLAALPTNAQFWLDVEYIGSSSTLGVIQSGGTGNVLSSGAALSADTSAWDSAATARANSTGYSLGSAIRLASNPGRVFFCTSAGASAASEPGGYASAVDGSVITDNTATFRAGFRFSMTVTLSSPQPGMVGYLTAYPRMAVASATLFLDPRVTLS